MIRLPPGEYERKLVVVRDSGLKLANEIFVMRGWPSNDPRGNRVFNLDVLVLKDKGKKCNES